MERRSEGPVPGFDKQAMDADLELQRNFEIGNDDGTLAVRIRCCPLGAFLTNDNWSCRLCF